MPPATFAFRAPESASPSRADVKACPLHTNTSLRVNRAIGPLDDGRLRAEACSAGQSPID